MKVAAALRDLAGEALDGEFLVAEVRLNGRANLVDELPVRRRDVHAVRDESLGARPRTVPGAVGASR